jgi:hypothetical protein
MPSGIRKDFPARLGDHLKQARQAAFVGRHEELRLFRQSLRGLTHGDRHDGSVLYVHAVGGTGKSALLHRFADEAEAAGGEVTLLDARSIERSPAGLQAAAAGLTGPRQVLLVDSFETCQHLESWFWRMFVPSLPEGTLLVVASRQPPGLLPAADPAWPMTTRVLPLGNLPREAAVQILRRHDVPVSLWEPLYAKTGGHPLAVIVAAEEAVRAPADAERWTAQAPAVSTLLDVLIGEVPSESHRRALEICAQVLTTREDLLRSVLGDRAPGLFRWLRAQPYIEAGADGLRPHDLVRDLLIADLRWRDPSGWQGLVARIRPHIVQRAIHARGAEVLPSQMALTYLHRSGPVLTDFLTWRGQGTVHETPYRPEHRAALVAMAARQRSAAEMAALTFWLDRQPGAFFVFCRPADAEPVAFVAWLDLSEPDAEETAADPQIGALWNHVERHGPPRPDRRLAVQRFLVLADGPPRPGPVMDLVSMRCVAVCLHDPRVTWTFVVMPDAGFWAPLLEYVDHRRLTGDMSHVFAHDWWTTPPEAWLDLLLERMVHGAEVPAPHSAFVALPRDQFAVAVREALRNWRHPSSFARNPLIDSRLAAGGDTESRVEALRSTIEDAVDTLQGTRHREKLHRVLAVTFFHGNVTQEAAAARIGIPFGTYRHRLAAAIDLLVDDLWQREAAITH